jgi:hypothetical protein
MGMNLIVDVVSFKPLLRELREKPGVFEVEGIMQRAGSKNENGRVYHRAILEREVKRFTENFINVGNAFGELDHPDSPVVSLKNASHVIKELKWSGDDLVGRVELLNTPSGNIVKEILKAGYAIGISSRGTGSVQQTNEGFLEVQNDFEIITWDFVSNPSTQNGFMKPVSLNEAKQEASKYAKLNQLLNDILRK